MIISVCFWSSAVLQGFFIKRLKNLCEKLVYISTRISICKKMNGLPNLRKCLFFQFSLYPKLKYAKVIFIKYCDFLYSIFVLFLSFLYSKQSCILSKSVIPLLILKLRDTEILGQCSARSALSRGENVPIQPWLVTLLRMVS